MTCKDCVHYDRCKDIYDNSDETYGIWKNVFDDEMYAEYGCDLFADKSKYIEAPCKVGDTFYVPYDSGIEEYECHGFVYLGEKISLITTYTMTFLLNEEAFLTRDEAEKALERINGND